MATFAQQLASDLSDVFHNTAEFGDDTIVYHPASGPARSITGMQTSLNARNRQPDTFHEYQIDTVSFVFANNNTTGMTSPQDGEVIEWDGRKWSFDMVISRDAAGIDVQWKSRRITRERIER